MKGQADYVAPVSDVREIPLVWVGVESSNIAQVGYNALSKTLAVKFNFGSVYYYYGVSEEVYMDMVSAESVGKFLHRSIKGKYAYGKLGD